MLDPLGVQTGPILCPSRPICLPQAIVYPGRRSDSSFFSRLCLHAHLAPAAGSALTAAGRSKTVTLVVQVFIMPCVGIPPVGIMTVGIMTVSRSEMGYRRN